MRDDAESRGELVQRADETRAMLLHTVEQLERRRHEAFDLRIQLERHFWQLAVLGAVLLLVTAGAASLIARRVAILSRRPRHARWHLAKLLVRRPDSAMLSQRRPFLHELARALLLPILTAAARRAIALASSARRSDASPPIA